MATYETIRGLEGLFPNLIISLIVRYLFFFSCWLSLRHSFYYYHLYYGIVLIIYLSYEWPHILVYNVQVELLVKSSFIRTNIWVTSTGWLSTPRKPKAHPWGRVSGFRRLPSPSPPCQHQKCVLMDVFFMSAGSPPLENQKHTPTGVFLAFAGSLPPLKHILLLLF